MKLPVHPSEQVIVVPVKLKGRMRVTARLVFDTGASYTMIPWRLAKGLGLEPELSTDRINITTASGVEYVPLVKVGAVEFLGREIKNVMLAIHDLPPGSNVDGLLGLSVLKHFNINLNFKEKFLEIK